MGRKASFRGTTQIFAVQTLCRIANGCEPSSANQKLFHKCPSQVKFRTNKHRQRLQPGRQLSEE